MLDLRLVIPSKMYYNDGLENNKINLLSETCRVEEYL